MSRTLTIRKDISTALAVEMPLHSIYQTTNLLADHINHRSEYYKEIAADTNLHPMTISKIASGITREPRMSTVFKLLDHFGYEFTMRRRQK